MKGKETVDRPRYPALPVAAADTSVENQFWDVKH
jgi:hypothetical protein